MEFDLSIRQLLSSRPCSVISKHSMHNICAYFIYSSFREYGSFLSLLFEIENIRWTLWNMLKTASLTAIIMLYVCVYVWICFWHICYKYNKNFSVYQIALISASIQSTIYDFSKHFVIIVCSLEKVSISNRPCCDPYISVLAESQRVIYVMQFLCWFSVYL